MTGSTDPSEIKLRMRLIASAKFELVINLKTAKQIGRGDSAGGAGTSD